VGQMKKPEASAHWLREQRDGNGLGGDGARLRFYTALPMPHHRLAYRCTPITVVYQAIALITRDRRMFHS